MTITSERHVALFLPVSATCEGLNVSSIASVSLLLLPPGSPPAPSIELAWRTALCDEQM